MNIFERAARRRIRFPSQRGMLSAEDLWHLSLQELDEIAKVLHKVLEDSTPVSFIGQGTDKKDDDPQLRFDIVKHVIDARLAEQASAEAAQLTKARKQRILGLIAEKKDAGLQALSVDELENLL